MILIGKQNRKQMMKKRIKSCKKCPAIRPGTFIPG